MSDFLLPKKAADGNETRDVRETTINVNGFTIRFDRSEKLIVYQYELVLLGIFVSPSRGRKEIDLVRSVKSDAQRQSRRVMLWELFHHVFDNYKDVFSGNKYEYVYDCGNILFSRHKIVEEGTKEISIDTSRLEGEARQQLQRLSEVIIKITHTGSMDLSSPDLWSSDSSSAAEQRCRGMQQFLDILTSQEINKRSDQLIYKNKRYNKQDEPGSEAHLSKVIKKGSEKNTAIIGDFGKEQEALLVIEPRCSPFFQTGKLQKYFEDVQREFRVSPSDRKFRTELKKHLTGLQVVTTHREKPQHLIIKGTTELSIREQTFSLTKDDKTVDVTVARYYEDTYNISVNKDYPCIVVDQMFKGKKEKGFYPCEVLEVTPGQRVQTQKQSPKLVEQLISHARMLPGQVKESTVAEHGKCQLNYNNKHLQAFGITIDDKLRTAPAKILPAPVVKYGNSRSENTDDDMSKRQWKLKRNTFVKPAKLADRSWVAVIIENALSCPTAMRFVTRYRECAKTHGMDLGEPVITRMQRTHTEDIWEKSRYWSANKVKFVLFIIGGDKRSIERDLLKESETLFSFVTQSVHMKTAIKAVEEHSGMVFQNIIMKTNLKLGGINHEILSLRNQPSTFANNLLPRDRMFIGLDMQSPGSPILGGPNEFSTDPTVVGMCFTVGSAADMRGSYWYQRATFKHMTMLTESITLALKIYMKHNRDQLPRDIVIFRGGVSEGEMVVIAREEIPQIQAAFQNKEFKKGGRRYEPHLTVILAQKQCGVRMMPVNINHSARGAQGQNVEPGTCVSSGIISPNRTEYILVAQNACIGTAKPTRYIVMHDTGIKPFTIQQLENMTNALCYLHGIVSLPVSRPAPLYSASDLVKRGHANWKSREVRHHETSSSGSGSRGPIGDDYFDPLNQKRLLFLPQKFDSKFWA